MACTWILSAITVYSHPPPHPHPPLAAQFLAAEVGPVAQAQWHRLKWRLREVTHDSRRIKNGRRIVHQQARKILINNDTEGARYLIQAFGVDATAVDYLVQHV